MPGPRPGSSEARGEAPLGEGGTLYDRAAAPALAFAEHLGSLDRAPDAAGLLREAGALLDRFAAGLRTAGVPPASVAPARHALGLVLDEAARANPAIPRGAWEAGAPRFLHDGEPMPAARVADLAARARAAGPAYAEVGRFIAAALAHAGRERARAAAPEPDRWGATLLSAVLGFLLLVGTWALQAEWRYHAGTARAFGTQAVAIGLDRAGPVPDLPARLDRLAAAVAGVEASLDKAPVRLFAGPLGFDAAEGARAAQAEALARHLPRALAGAIGEALASEGESAQLYDTLRAWDVLSGAAEWSPGYLAGWLAARPGLVPGAEALARQVPLMPPPPSPPPAPDPELLDQARALAAGTPESERVWIELARSPAMTALPGWSPAGAVPGLAEVALRRSGRDLADPLPGAFTQAGWDLAAGGGAASAVARARVEAARMFGQAPPSAPDAADRVLLRLQDETLAAWRGLLDDLRVRPLASRGTATLVTGLLARGDSPLEALLRAAWAEAGGEDDSRPPEARQQVAAALGPAIAYVEGGRMGEIARLFAALNAALAARDLDEEVRLGRLMGLQESAASVAALGQAPLLVVQMVEDVLAQTAVAQAEPVANPTDQTWQAEVYDLCQRVAATFPFDPAGPDAEPSEVAALLGPGGAIERYFLAVAEPQIDTSATPWRWRPEARFEGRDPAGAEFFQRARAISAGLFGPAGMATEVTVAAQAERGRATVTIGGAAAEASTSGAPAPLAWPGPDPARGASVAFAGGGTVAAPGPWGLLRILASVRLRPRDGGRLMLVDVRAEGGRVLLALGFPSPDNPASRLALMRGFACPAAL